MSDSLTPLPGILSTIVAVFRQNGKACVMLNVVVLTLVMTYYRMPLVAAAWEEVGALKLRWSYAFSLCSTVFAAVLLPFCIQTMLGTLPASGRGKRLVLLVLFWGYRGMEIDLFYRFQSFLFGDGHDAPTLMTKVALDQFVASPLWFVPTYLIALRWIDQGGSWSDTRKSLDRAFWTRTFPTVLITNWIVWIPALALVYSLPAALQFPLFTVVMCFFILIVTLLASAGDPVASESEGSV
jgi:hypothetical protein